MISTHDNPYDPFDNFDEWYSFDVLNKYNSNELLMRNCFINDELMSENEKREIVEESIDEIVNKYPLIFKKVIKEIEE